MLLLKDLTVEFQTPEGPIRAVDRVNLEVKGKEKVAIIGETGSGKSVLLLALLRLLPPSACIRGAVWFAGQDLLTLPNAELQRIRGRRVAYVPQGAGNALNPVLTVGEQVAEPMLVHLGLKKPVAFKKAAGLLEQMGIVGAKKWLCAYPHQYSGGMKQRALVAMGVAAEAGLLLADEPTKGVDWENREEILRLFQSLEGKAVLAVTHDLWFAEKFARRVAVMYAAQIVETAQTEALFARPLHPYARALLAALPGKGLRPLAGFAPAHAGFKELGCRFSERCPKAFDSCHQEPPLVEKDSRLVRCWLYA